jgi:hypothetical protein
LACASLLLHKILVLSVMALSSPLSLFVASVAQEKMVLESEIKVNQIHRGPVGLCACTFGRFLGVLHGNTPWSYNGEMWSSGSVLRGSKTAGSFELLALYWNLCPLEEVDLLFYS